MADLENPTRLKLGRVGVEVPVLRQARGYTGRDETSAVDGILALGKTISGAMVKEQRRKEFYEGQDRILQASLQGTQKEELTRVLDEQPWYMQLMGPGAVAEGAVEMASRVGAGRVFDGNLARLAEGMDAEIDPDTYREQVLQQVQTQRTGREEVDAVFIPQMVAKAQSVISTHLQKHLEFNAKSAMTATVTESYDALGTLHTVVQKEQGPSATFVEGTARELMTTAQGHAYDNVVQSFNPEARPRIVEEAGWIKGKVSLAVAALERGDTVVYQAMQESGLFGKLSAEERVKVDEARLKGKKENDSNNRLQFIGLETALLDKILDAKTDADLQAVFKDAQQIALTYDEKGITRPAEFKNDDAIKEHVFKAMGRKDAYDDKMENRRYTELQARKKVAADLALVAAQKAAAVDQTNALNAAMLTNALGNNPTAPVFVPNETGALTLFQPTKADRTNAYTQYKGMLMQLPPEQRQAELLKRGVKSVEELAYRFQIIDENTQGRLTQYLRAANGKPKMDKYADAAIAQVTALAATGDFEYVKDHVQDDGLKKNLVLFNNALKLTGDKDLAWSKSFGRDPNVKVSYDTSRFNKAVKSGDSAKLIKEAGRFGPQVQAAIEAEGKGNIEAGMDIADGLTVGTDTVRQHAEVSQHGFMMNVPRESRISARTGITNTRTLDKAVEYQVRSALPKGIDKFELQYIPSTDKHMVIPVDTEGRPRFNAAFPLDYKKVGEVINDPAYFKERLHGSLLGPMRKTDAADAAVDEQFQKLFNQ